MWIIRDECWVWRPILWPTTQSTGHVRSEGIVGFTKVTTDHVSTWTESGTRSIKGYKDGRSFGMNTSSFRPHNYRLASVNKLGCAPIAFLAGLSLLWRNSTPHACACTSTGWSVSHHIACKDRWFRRVSDVVRNYSTSSIVALYPCRGTEWTG